MNDFQIKVFEIMKWFHSICLMNNLRYYMLGGTMLGAIRHKGFIPWDDDADFGMPRNDYEKFIEITNNLNDNSFVVESYHNGNKDFPYPFVKVYDKNTTLIEDLRIPIKRGLYIDVFPLDGTGITKKESDGFQRKCFHKINYVNTKTCKLSKKRKLYKNVAICLSRLIPPYSINHIKTSRRLNMFVSKKSFEASNFLANFFGAWQKKETMPKSVFGEARIYSFEGFDFFGPSDYDSYLKNLYNDYMSLPPVEKRGNHHSYLSFDLNKSYMVEHD